MTTAGVLAGGLAVAVALMLGCTALRDPNESCSKSPAMCATSGLSETEASSPWACVGKIPPPLPDTIKAVTYTTQIVTIANTDTNALKGLTVSLCHTADIPYSPPDAGLQTTACLHPIASSMPDPSFPLSIALPARTPKPQDDLFISFVSGIPFASGGTLPGALWFNRPPTDDVVSKTSIVVVDLAHAQSVISLLGKPFAPQLGIVLLNIFDCNGQPAAGVHATLDQSNQSSNYAMFSFALQRNGVTTLQQETDSSGQFGFVNVGPGACEAHLFLGSEPIGDVGFTARGGWGTGVDFRL